MGTENGSIITRGEPALQVDMQLYGQERGPQPQTLYLRPTEREWLETLATPYLEYAAELRQGKDFDGDVRILAVSEAYLPAGANFADPQILQNFLSHRGTDILTSKDELQRRHREHDDAKKLAEDLLDKMGALDDAFPVLRQRLRDALKKVEPFRERSRLEGKVRGLEERYPEARYRTLATKYAAGLLEEDVDIVDFLQLEMQYDREGCILRLQAERKKNPQAFSIEQKGRLIKTWRALGFEKEPNKKDLDRKRKEKEELEKYDPFRM